MFCFWDFRCKIGTNIDKKIKSFRDNFLFVIIILFNVNEFSKVLIFAFKVTDLIPSQVFLMSVEYF